MRVTTKVVRLGRGCRRVCFARQGTIQTQAQPIAPTTSAAARSVMPTIKLLKPNSIFGRRGNRYGCGRVRRPTAPARSAECPSTKLPRPISSENKTFRGAAPGGFQGKPSKCGVKSYPHSQYRAASGFARRQRGHSSGMGLPFGIGFAVKIARPARPMMEASRVRVCRHRPIVLIRMFRGAVCGGGRSSRRVRRPRAEIDFGSGHADRI